ncbi:hypothetical protein CLV30_12745 [Haloactinopolyspora alba]|uniref:Uncharacterized protein n=1 Tax=Haloactinopolyspora alba TaxID=648780 RepID=A0A2P8DFW1_9ACTN|nr:hypothetical protein [Haloactinopolyspora alba]PSK96104.1 hypothetical protein CLV30_12745 [Haloactinopolyspora alba]
MISDDVHRLGRELDRVVRDLRRSGAGFAPHPAPPSWAECAHSLAQWLADAAADAQREPRRAVPRLGGHAVADQVAVVGRDVLEVARVGGDVDVAAARQAVACLREELLRAAR